MPNGPQTPTLGSSSAASSGPSTSPVASIDPSIASTIRPRDRLRPALRAAAHPVPRSRRDDLDVVAPARRPARRSRRRRRNGRRGRPRARGTTRSPGARPAASPRRPSGSMTSAVAGSPEDRTRRRAAGTGPGDAIVGSARLQPPAARLVHDRPSRVRDPIAERIGRREVLARRAVRGALRPQAPARRAARHPCAPPDEARDAGTVRPWRLSWRCAAAPPSAAGS